MSTAPRGRAAPCGRLALDEVEGGGRPAAPVGRWRAGTARDRASPRRGPVCQRAPVTAPDRTALLRSLYAAFTARDLDSVLAAMAPDVDWPNGWEGGRLHGHDGVRGYWERQWAQIRPLVRPTAVEERADGSVVVTVALTVRDPGGAVRSRETVRHVYRFDGDLVARMDVERPPH